MRTPAIWKPETQANQIDNNATQFDGTIAALPNGSYDVVWVDTSGTFGAGNVLVGRQFDANGNPLTNDIALVSAGSFAPDVTGLPNNGVDIAFSFDIGGGDFNTYIARYSSSLTFLGFTNIETGATPSFNPAITSFANGSVFVTYTLENSAIDWHIEGQLVNSSGTAVGAPIDLAHSGDGFNNSPVDSSHVAALVNGNIVIVHESTFSAGDHDVIFQIRTPSGTVIKGQAFVDNPLGLFLTEPDVAALRTGGFVVTFTQGTGGNQDIHAVVYDQSGNIVRNNFIVNSTRTGTQDAAHVTAMDDGGFLVGWRDTNLFVNNAQRFDSAGNAVGAEFRTHTGFGLDNDVTTLADGRAAFVTSTALNFDYDVIQSIWDTRHNDTNMVSGSNFAGSSTADVMIERESTANIAEGGIRTYLAVSINNAQAGAATTYAIVGADWMLDASGDFNGDGRADMVAHHDVGSVRHIDIFSTGANGSVAADIADLAIVGTDWQVNATGDFNHDGFSDIMISRDAGGLRTYDIIGIANNQRTSFTQVGITATQTILDGLGDFNGDGTPDLLFHTDNNGVRALQVQDMQNGQPVGGAPVTAQIGSDWQIDGIADFNSDGFADILIHRDGANSRTLGILTTQNNVQTGFQQIGVVGKNVQIEGVGDYEGTGKPDILIQSIANFGTSNAQSIDQVLVINNSDPNHISAPTATTIAVTGVNWLVA